MIIGVILVIIIFKKTALSYVIANNIFIVTICPIVTYSKKCMDDIMTTLKYCNTF